MTNGLYIASGEKVVAAAALLLLAALLAGFLERGLQAGARAWGAPQAEYGAASGPRAE